MAGRKLPPERVRLVLDHLAAGMNPLRAARAAGVSHGFAYQLHHKMGGVYRPPGTTYSDRYLDREERYEIARLRGSGLAWHKVYARDVVGVRYRRLSAGADMTRSRYV